MRAARVPDMASLAWGLPSFATPASIREAVKAGLDGDADAFVTLPGGLGTLEELQVPLGEVRDALGLTLPGDAVVSVLGWLLVAPAHPDRRSVVD